MTRRLQVPRPAAHPGAPYDPWAAPAASAAAILAPHLGVDVVSLRADLTVAVRRERASEYEAKEAAEITAWLARRNPPENVVGLFVSRLRAVRAKEGQ